ncbi:MAG: PilZ domain-containing protein [Candidatus Omnitrophota bacterium]
MVERRIFARINIRIPLKFLISSNDKVGDGEMVDISANGVGFLTKEDIPPKTPLQIWVKLPDHHEPIHLIGKVAWSQDSGQETLKRVGVCLEEDRLLELGRVWLYKDTHPNK